MQYKSKSKKELIEEIEALNQKLRDLEKKQLLFQEGKTGYLPSQYITDLLDNAQESIGILQDETHIYVNKRASEIDGRPVEELIGKHMRITTHPDDYPLALQNYYKKLRGERVDKYRYRSINKEGQVIWLDIIGTAILWGGRPAVLNFVTDVTKEVMAEEALKKSERMLSDILNFLPDPTFAIDKEGRIISWNREMEEMAGIKAEEMLGKDRYEYALPFYGERKPMLVDMISHPEAMEEERFSYFKKEGNFLYAEQNFKLQGRIRSLWCKASLIYNHKNEVIGAIESMRDVTDFRKAVEELKNKSANIEEANTALKVLLENRQREQNEIEEKIFNNIKTLIIPYLDQLKVSNLDGRQNAYIRILENHINEIFSPFLKKMTAHYSNFTPRELQIADLVKDGKSTKEISQILNIAVNTTNNYRKRLRKKLSLMNKDENLRSHLLSIL